MHSTWQRYCVLLVSALVVAYFGTGLMAMSRAPVLWAQGDALSIDTLSNLVAVNGTPLADLSTHRQAQHNSTRRHKPLWATHHSLFDSLADESVVSLRFVFDGATHVEWDAHLVRRTFGQVLADASLEYLSGALLLVFGFYVLRRHLGAAGSLLALASGSLAVLIVSAVPILYRPLTLSPNLVQVLMIGVHLGSFGLVFLAHALLAFPTQDAKIRYLTYLIYALYAYLAVKTIGFIGAGLPMSLSPLLVMVGAVMLAGAAALFVQLRRTAYVVGAPLELWPVWIGALLLILAPFPNLWDETKLALLMGLLPALIFSLVVALQVQDGIGLRSAFERSLLRERELIRRELHDGVLNDLASIVATADGLKRTAGSTDDTIVRRTDTLRKLAQDVSQRVRDLLKDALGHNASWAEFSTAMVRYAEHVLGAVGIGLRVDVAPEIAQLPPLPFSACVNLEHIFRETIVNIVKHSQATQVVVSFQLNRNFVSIEIQDNGRGYRIGDALHAGFGLHHMRARLDELGGTLAMDAVPQWGTRVQLKIPAQCQEHGSTEGHVL